MDEYQTPDRDVLEYYHSPLAGQAPFYQLARLARNPSARSSSSSDDSCLSDTKDSDASSQLSRATHRLSVPSVGNPDRRPIAKAPVEQNTAISSISPRAHPTKRLRDHQTSSDVVSSHRADAPLPNPAATNPLLSHHNCSASSEFLPSSKGSSRDIGIVGTVTGVKQQSPTQMPSQNNNSHSPPVFQQPESATVSPPSTPDLALPLAPLHGLNVMKRDKPKEVPANASRLVANKENHAPIGHFGLDTAADLIGSGIRLVKSEQTQNPDFASTPPLLSTHPSSDPTLLYVNYQPGIHSTAGPLPPPPRLPGFDALAASSNSPPPPRPPRLNSPLPPRNAARPKDIEVVKQALQLPPSVSAALASRSQKVVVPDGVNAPNDNVDPVPTVARSTTNFAIPSSPSVSESSSSSYCMLQHTSPIHRREGALASSCASTDASSESRFDSVRDTTETQSNTILKPEVSSNGGVPQGMTAPELSLPSPILESAAEHIDNNDAHLHQSVPSNRSQDHGEMTDKSGDGDGEDSNENWVSVSRELSPSCGGRSTPGTDVNVDEKNDNAGINRELSDSPSEAPSPPPKNFRNSLTTGLKRFSTRSLPRTPSVSSGSRRSPSVISKRFSNQSENQASSGSGGLDLPSPSICSAPSPSHPVNSNLPATNAGVGAREHRQARAVRKKVVQQWPSAMFCNGMHGRGNRKMTSSEKCAIYRRKINELYIYDCGLSGWVEEMKFRGPNSNQHGNGASNKKFPDARSPTDSLFIPKPRQTSRSSMISDATFPTRPDASTATDLLSPSRDNNDGYLEDVPILPYPSLATAQRAAASNVPTNQTPPGSIRSYGSSSTLPSVTVLSSNHPLASVNTLTPSTQSPGTTPHHTPASLPLNRSFTTSTGGGFFASLSRKASLGSTKKPALGIGLNFKSSVSSSSYSGLVSPSIIQRHPTKSSLGSPGAGRSKPVTVGGIAMDRSTPPSIVPGGPRALSNGGSIRLQRSKTYVPCKKPQFNSVGSSSSTTVNNIERRPSLWELQSKSSLSLAGPASSSTTPTQSYSPYTPSLCSAPYQGHNGYTLVDQNQIQPPHQSEPNGYVQPQQQQPPSVYDPQTDLEFIRQIDKLAELLPNANRMVLTGYLRRAGQDVLAIGQYLEDEKNGTLKAY